MLDVHPPHESVHTWRDFFIHIATIVIGLLIAVGLEQTVEYLHHRHQRMELIESLKVDTAICEEDGRNTAEARQKKSVWLLDRETRINDALWSGSPVTDLPDPPVGRKTEVLSYTHFQAGKASGLLQLLSTEDMDAFSDVNFDVQLANKAEDAYVQAVSRRRGFEAALRDRTFKRLDLTRATPADLREYLRLLEAERDAAIGDRFSSDVAEGAAAAVLRGERGIRKLQQAENEAVDRDLGATK